MVLAKSAGQRTAYQRYCYNHYFKCDDSWSYGHGSSGGTTIFNITKNYGYGYGYGGYNCCGGGSFWSGFGKGLGWGLGQGLMSFFGGGLFGGMFGCGFGGFSPFGGGFNWGDIFGSKKAKKEEKEEKPATTTTTPASTTTTASTPTTIEKINTDYPTLNSLFKEKNDLLEKPNVTKAELEAFLKKVEDLEKAGKLDGIQDNDDKNYIIELKRGISEKIASLTDSTPVTPVDNNDGNGNNLETTLGNLSWNSLATDPTLPDTLPEGYEYATKDNIGGKTFNGALEINGKNRNVNVNNGHKTIGKHKENGVETDFPEYYIAKDDNGINYAYKCQKIINGKAIYVTPSGENGDKNNNIYVLAIIGNNLELVQVAGMSGHTKPDTQKGITITEE